MLKLKVLEQSVLVQLEPPELHLRAVQSSLRYKIYLTHPGGEEVRSRTRARGGGGARLRLTGPFCGLLLRSSSSPTRAPGS